MEDSEKIYQCFDCPDGVQIFSSEEDLLTHKWDMIRASKAKSHMNCHVCKLEHKTFAGLVRHYQLQHPAKQKLACPGCEQPFGRLHLLMYHLENGQCYKVDGLAVSKGRHVQARATTAPNLLAAAGGGDGAAADAVQQTALGIFNESGVNMGDYGRYIGITTVASTSGVVNDMLQEQRRAGRGGEAGRLPGPSGGPASPGERPRPGTRLSPSDDSSPADGPAAMAAVAAGRTVREFRHGDSKAPDLLTDDSSPGRNDPGRGMIVWAGQEIMVPERRPRPPPIQPAPFSRRPSVWSPSRQPQLMHGRGEVPQIPASPDGNLLEGIQMMGLVSPDGRDATEKQKEEAAFLEKMNALNPDHPDHPRFNVNKYKNKFSGRYNCPHEMCRRIGKIFKTANGLVQHLTSDTAHTTLRVQCPSCFGFFTSVMALTQHCESQSARCHFRDSEEYLPFLNILSAGVADVKGRNIDMTVAYEVQEGAAQALGNATKAVVMANGEYNDAPGVCHSSTTVPSFQGSSAVKRSIDDDNDDDSSDERAEDEDELEKIDPQLGNRPRTLSLTKLWLLRCPPYSPWDRTLASKFPGDLVRPSPRGFLFFFFFFEPMDDSDDGNSSQLYHLDPFILEEETGELPGEADVSDRDPYYTTRHHRPAAGADANMQGRRLARRIERACCTCATYFPLVFVYGLTSWAVWVMIHLSTTPTTSGRASAWIGPWCAAVAVVLYGMLLWSYTTAVFSSPGSTTNDHGYSTLPVAAPSNHPMSAAGAGAATSLTVKANGEMRFCKKCQARKPDRAHHCSTCRRCVLKMDHHCPWLANCIGLRNAKAFVLFLIYTSLFADFSFTVAGAWVWTEIIDDTTYASYGESLMPIQYIMLCVIAGIVGLVVTLFTAWHIVLACRGQTTIECMEKTRYQSPLRSKTAATVVTMASTLGGALTSVGNGSSNEQGVPLPQYGRQLNQLSRGDGRRIPDEEQGLFDGVEGAHDDHDYDYDYPDSSAAPRGPAEQMGRRLTYNDLERYRAQKRHEEYLDQQDSEKLPHAFDLGARRNLLHLFGTRPWLWPLPICTTTGDGWSWEPSPKWLAARDRIRQERDAQLARERAAGWGLADDSPMPSPPIIVTTTATPPRPQAQNPPARNYSGRPAPLLNFNSSTKPAPSRYRRSPTGPGAAPSPSPSKADRVLGRDPGLSYADGPGSSPGSAGLTSPNAVSMQRLNAEGRAMRLREDHLFDDDDDEEEEEEEEEEDDLDNTSEEETAAAPLSQQRQRSPLRAPWMPDPTSGLVRKSSTVSTSPTAAALPSGEPTASILDQAAADNANRHGSGGGGGVDDGGVD